MEKDKTDLEYSKNYLKGFGLVVGGLLVIIVGSFLEHSLIYNSGLSFLALGIGKMVLTGWKNLNLKI